MSKITHVEVRMYRMGTGDCFVLQFHKADNKVFKILIDSGVWSGEQRHIEEYVKDLKDYVKNHVDVLIVTHEHKDHVYAFDVCEELFTNDFTIGEVWMAWTENDKTKIVKDWKDKYGQHKTALGIAAQKLKEVINDDNYKKQFTGNRFGLQALEARRNFADVVEAFADLHLSKDNNNLYAGGLAGMDVVKKLGKKTTIRYFNPGEIMADLDDAPGMKIYVLGPPKVYEEIATEAGGKGETYDHNKVLEKSGAFGAAINGLNGDELAKNNLLPFDDHYTTDQDILNKYDEDDWRKIDYDWLYSAGSFALRMNGLTNNLSLALAFEFEESGRVMLFPGDAEFGSWQSWHKIDWGQKGKDGKTPLVEDLLNRTVFYKVAHHLSHNGTAQRLGLEMMNHNDLVAMATLDYDVISNGWKSTMPNRALIKELVKRTKGRLMILKEEGLFYDFHQKEPMAVKINEAKETMTKKEKADFDNSFKSTDLYLQYTVKA
jgi:hypothetical protein